MLMYDVKHKNAFFVAKDHLGVTRGQNVNMVAQEGKP